MNERATRMLEEPPRGNAGRQAVVSLSGGRALFVGPTADTQPHAHHALQSIVSLGGPFRVRESTSTPWETFDAAVVTPDAPHQLDGVGEPIALVYLDPESTEGRMVAARLARPGIHPVEGTRVDEFRAHALALWRGDVEVSTHLLMTSVVDALVGSSVFPAPLDLRVRKALDLFESLPGRRAPLDAIAAAVSLSPGRFAHLFREQTRLAVRRYLLWLRLRDAVEEVVIGRSLTEAAHAAGFSDSAHLTRTFREMFGVAPSAAFKGCRFVREVGP